MTLYIACTAEKEVFDPSRHLRSDLDVFHFSLTQKEGEWAIASLLIKNTLKKLSAFEDKKHILIATKPEGGEAIFLFQGRLQTPIKLEGNSVWLAFTAAPEDAEQQLQALTAQSKNALLWDPLFVSPHQQETPEEMLRAQSVVFHYDRLNHKISLSSLFKGTHFKDVGKIFYQDSLALTPGTTPLSAVEMTLEVQWIQKIRSYASLSRKIAQAFPEKIINTFTGKNFSKRWPQTGQTLNHSGYWVALSDLTEINPPRNLYPARSKPLWMQRTDAETAPAYVKRSWFKGKLVVGWSYKQKRVEKITFTLLQSLHSFFKEGAVPSEKIHLTLGEISPRQSTPHWIPGKFYDKGVKIQEEGKIYRCLTSHRSGEKFSDHHEAWKFSKNIPTALGAPSRSSFFLTPRGYTAFEHALEIAKTRLAHSARALQISFSGPWESLCTLSLDHTVRLSDPRLPGGRVRGKVVSTTLVVDGKTGERRVDATLAVSVGFKASEKAAQPGPDYCDPGYVDALYTAAEKIPQYTPSGLLYERYDTQTPEPAGDFGPRAVVKNLFLKNTAQEQEMVLQAHQYPQGTLSNATLKDCATTLRLDLNPLSSKDKIEHQIFAQILSTWSAPLQIGSTKQ